MDVSVSFEGMLHCVFSSCYLWPAGQGAGCPLLHRILKAGPALGGQWELEASLDVPMVPSEVFKLSWAESKGPRVFGCSCPKGSHSLLVPRGFPCKSSLSTGAASPVCAWTSIAKFTAITIATKTTVCTILGLARVTEIYARVVPPRLVTAEGRVSERRPRRCTLGVQRGDGTSWRG